MRMRAPAHAALQSLKEYSAACLRARYFTPRASSRRSSATASVCSPFSRTPESAICRRSCFLEMRPGGLCVSLTPKTIDEVFSTDVSGADCVEVRLDYLKQPEQSTHARWDRFAVPVIATCRG